MEVGEIIAGKYRVDRVLGRGGMGLVVAADHLQLDQRVALKVLVPEAAREPIVRERFVREAKASAQLRSEHVCRVSDVGALADGSPYMVMELLDGCDLATVITSHGALPVAIAVDYVLEACVGVAEAHAFGVVHRDLKPANLFLAKRPDGTAIVKVLDFGIAKSQRQTEIASLTQTQSVLGSPGYMSPEQLRESRTVDVRSDVWSLGVILYELVTGERPFGGETITEIALAVTLDPAPRMPAAIPAAFAAVVMRCLEKDPAHRYPHLAALAAALAPFGREPAGELAASVARVLANTVERTSAKPPTGPHALPEVASGPSSERAITPPRRSIDRPRRLSSELPPTVAHVVSSSAAKPASIERRPGFLRRHGLAAALVGGLLACTTVIVLAASLSGTDGSPNPAAPRGSKESPAVSHEPRAETQDDASTRKPDPSDRHASDPDNQTNRSGKADRSADPDLRTGPDKPGPSSERAHVETGSVDRTDAIHGKPDRSADPDLGTGRPGKPGPSPERAHVETGRPNLDRAIHGNPDRSADLDLGTGHPGKPGPSAGAHLETRRPNVNRTDAIRTPASHAVAKPVVKDPAVRRDVKAPGSSARSGAGNNTSRGPEDLGASRF